MFLPTPEVKSERQRIAFTSLFAVGRGLFGLRQRYRALNSSSAMPLEKNEVPPVQTRNPREARNGMDKQESRIRTSSKQNAAAKTRASEKIAETKCQKPNNGNTGERKMGAGRGLLAVGSRRNDDRGATGERAWKINTVYRSKAVEIATG
jgi:hypothetical protein